jgi:hypothetical protein
MPVTFTSLPDIKGNILKDTSGNMYITGWLPDGKYTSGPLYFNLPNVQSCDTSIDYENNTSNAVFIGNDGHVYGWGEIPIYGSMTNAPTKIIDKTAINCTVPASSQIIFYDGTIFILNQSGELYGFGSNKSCRLGLDHSIPESSLIKLNNKNFVDTFVSSTLVPTQISYIRGTRHYHSFAYPNEINIVSNNDTTRPRPSEEGDYGNAILALQNGQVYAWGSIGCGSLAQEIYSQKYLPIFRYNYYFWQENISLEHDTTNRSATAISGRAILDNQGDVFLVFPRDLRFVRDLTTNAVTTQYVTSSIYTRAIDPWYFPFDLIRITSSDDPKMIKIVDHGDKIYAISENNKLYAYDYSRLSKQSGLGKFILINANHTENTSYHYQKLQDNHSSIWVYTAENQTLTMTHHPDALDDYCSRFSGLGDNVEHIDNEDIYSRRGFGIVENSAKLHIYDQDFSFTVGETQIILNVRQSEQFNTNYNVSISSNQNVTWDYDVSKLLQISSNGIYQAKGTGYTDTSTDIIVTPAAVPTTNKKFIINISPAELTVTPENPWVDPTDVVNFSYDTPVGFGTVVSDAWSITPIYTGDTTVVDASGEVTISPTPKTTQYLLSVQAQSANYYGIGQTIINVYEITISVYGPGGQFINQGGARTYIATVQHDGGAGVDWSVHGTVCGTIDSGGNYTAPHAHGIGNTRNYIRATSKLDVSKFGEAQVTINDTSIEIIIDDPYSLILKQGEVQEFSATITGTEYTNVTWTVDGGTFTDEHANPVEYTAPHGSSVPQEFSLTVSLDDDPLLSDTVDLSILQAYIAGENNIVVYQDSDHQLTTTIEGTEYTDVTYSITEGATGGTITIDGLYTAPHQEGIFHIVTTLDDTGEEIVTKVIVPPIRISVTPANPFVAGNTTQQFEADVINHENTDVTWEMISVSGSIDENGVFTAPLTPGNYYLKAIADADSDIQAIAMATVEEITITTDIRIITLDQYEEHSFEAFVYNTTNTDVTWSVAPGDGTIDDPDANPVTYNAPYGTGSEGTHTLTVTSDADPTKTTDITITVNPVVVEISPETSDVDYGDTISVTATVTGTTNDTTVTWSAPDGGTLENIEDNSVTLRLPTTGGSSFRIIATSDEDSTKNATSTISTENIYVHIYPSILETAYSEETQFYCWLTGTIYPWELTSIEFPAEAEEAKAVVISDIWYTYLEDKFHIYDFGTPGWSTSTSNTFEVYDMGLTYDSDLIYLYGGNNALHPNTLTIYNTTLDNWDVDAYENTLDNANRHSCGATSDATNIYIVGGVTYDVEDEEIINEGLTAKVHAFNISGETWSELSDLPLACSGECVNDGTYIYFFNGSDIFIYNIGLDSWTNGTRCPSAISGFRIILYNDYLYVIGTNSDLSNGIFYAYDIDHDYWYKPTQNKNEVFYNGSFIEYDDSIYISGIGSTEVWQYDFTEFTPVWSVIEGAGGGTIDSDGLYTAPATSGTYHVQVSFAGDTETSTIYVDGTKVRIYPKMINILINESEDLRAIVKNDANTDVTWQIVEGEPTGGTLSNITANSVTYTAPANNGTYHIEATSDGDPTVSDIITVVVNDNFYWEQRSGLSLIGKAKELTSATEFGQNIKARCAISDMLSDILGGEGIYGGGAKTFSALGPYSGNNNVAKYQYPPIYMIIRDDFYQSWYFVTEFYTDINFNISDCPNGILYAVIKTYNEYEKDYAVGKDDGLQFEVYENTEEAPAHSVVLGSGIVENSQFTSFVINDSAFKTTTDAILWKLSDQESEEEIYDQDAVLISGGNGIVTSTSFENDENNIKIEKLNIDVDLADLSGLTFDSDGKMFVKCKSGGVIIIDNLDYGSTGALIARSPFPSLSWVLLGDSGTGQTVINGSTVQITGNDSSIITTVEDVDENTKKFTIELNDEIASGINWMQEQTISSRFDINNLIFKCGENYLTIKSDELRKNSDLIIPNAGSRTVNIAGPNLLATLNLNSDPITIPNDEETVVRMSNIVSEYFEMSSGTGIYNIIDDAYIGWYYMNLQFEFNANENVGERRIKIYNGQLGYSYLSGNAEGISDESTLFQLGSIFYIASTDQNIYFSVYQNSGDDLTLGQNSWFNLIRLSI